MSDGAVEVDHRRRHDLPQPVVERRDPLPVGIFRLARLGVTGGERGLQGVAAVGAAQRFGAFEGCEATTDEELVPAGTVLLGDWHEPAVCRRAGGKARCLNLHQGDQA